MEEGVLVISVPFSIVTATLTSVPFPKPSSFSQVKSKPRSKSNLFLQFPLLQLGKGLSRLDDCLLPLQSALQAVLRTDALQHPPRLRLARFLGLQRHP